MRQTIPFTILAANVLKYGGKYRDEAHARSQYPNTDIIRVEQRPLWDDEFNKEMDRDKAWHRTH